MRDFIINRNCQPRHLLFAWPGLLRSFNWMLAEWQNELIITFQNIFEKAIFSHDFPHLIVIYFSSGLWLHTA